MKLGVSPLTGGLPDSPGEIVGTKFDLVMSYPVAVSVVTNYFTGRTGQAAQHRWSYDTVKRQSAPLQKNIPHENKQKFTAVR